MTPPPLISIIIMLSKEDFNAEGFDVSTNIEQSKIDRAEADIDRAYINPILNASTETEIDTCLVKKTRLNLVYLALLQRSSAVTRAGAKMKTTLQSSTASIWDVIGEQASICDLLLRSLAASAGVKNPSVTDICKIYFKTNFFSY